MEKLVMTIPTLYGDHHTTAVKDILAGIDGVQDSYVSSAFQQVSVSFDPKVVQAEAIRETLAGQGYGEGEPQGEFTKEAKDHAARHTAAYSGTGYTLSFAEAKAPFQGRPLWPCPGLSVPTTAEEA
jgi:copper chaperone CopZ